jgi:hypothetical protein
VEVCGTLKEINYLTNNLNTMNVDVEIYMNNIIKFFKENPNDLLNLVPKTKEEEFYFKLREVANQNYEKGEEVNLTKNQIIIICAELHGKSKKTEKESLELKTINELLNDEKYQELNIEKLIINTPFGNYSLN